MYYPILPHRLLLAAIISSGVYYSKEFIMIKKTTIESQLDCRATAALRSSIAEDLSKPDKPIADILSKDEGEEKDESQDESNNSN